MKGRARSEPSSYPLEYVVEILEWDWSLRFGLQHDRHSRRAYSDFRHIELSGQLVMPQGITSLPVELTILPDIEPETRRTDEFSPQAVGSLDLQESRLWGLVSMPKDALAPVLQMLAVKRLRYLSLYGPRLRRRKTLIQSYRLHRCLREDD